MLRAEGTPETEQPWGKTDGTVAAVGLSQQGDQNEEELPGKGKDTLPGVEEEDEFGAACARGGRGGGCRGR